LQKRRLCETKTIINCHEQKAKNICKQEEKQINSSHVVGTGHSVQQKKERTINLRIRRRKVMVIK